MISPEDGDFVWIFDLEGEQQTDSLDTLSSSINVIAHEEIGGIRREASVFEEPEHVVVLSVNISADLYWCTDFYEHGLFHEYVFSCANESEDVIF